MSYDDLEWEDSINMGYPRSHVTNFKDCNESFYEQAIAEFGSDSLYIAFNEPGDKYPMALHCADPVKDLSEFWKIFNRIATSSPENDGGI